MSTGLKVSDILARAVGVEWHEGVALVREVTHRLIDPAGSSVSLPDLHEIELSAAGGVAVLGGGVVADPVRRLGQLLQAILAHSEPPVQLRLLIAQATAPQPGFASMGEYDRALEFFDPPNRTEVLAALFARAASAPAPIEPRARPTVEAMAPLPVEEKRRPAPTTSARRRTLQVVAAALVFAFACTAGLLYARRVGLVPRASAVSGAAIKASDTLGSAITTGLSAVSERAGLGRLVFANEPSGAEAPVVATAVDVKRPKTSQRAVPQTSSAVSFGVFDLPSLLGSDATNGVPSGGELVASVINVELSPDEDLDTYSLGSEGVSSPVGVRPQLPRELPADVDPATLTRIELLILPDGTVESAKLIGTPRNVVDSMLLSAAKTWEFEPAMKAGQPVRYRKTVWVTSQ